MKKLSLYELRMAFRSVAVVLFIAFAGFGLYLYSAFNDPLTGDVHQEEVPDLLSILQEKKIEAALNRLETRSNLPDIPPDLPNPFTTSAP
ncbi:MAG: hypothetical protein QY323_02445 [Patescibacteria group bacterium]|nr:MAG: hypothetical protein QY323_02445 [Patescibacteria group bacterium]